MAGRLALLQAPATPRTAPPRETGIITLRPAALPPPSPRGPRRRRSPRRRPMGPGHRRCPRAPSIGVTWAQIRWRASISWRPEKRVTAVLGTPHSSKPPGTGIPRTADPWPLRRDPTARSRSQTHRPAPGSEWRRFRRGLAAAEHRPLRQGKGTLDRLRAKTPYCRWEVRRTVGGGPPGPRAAQKSVQRRFAGILDWPAGTLPAGVRPSRVPRSRSPSPVPPCRRRS